MGFLNKILESVDEKKKGLRKNIKESHDMHLEFITQDWFESKYLKSKPYPLLLSRGPYTTKFPLSSDLPAWLPKSKCNHACKHNFKEQKLMVYDGLEAWTRDL